MVREQACQRALTQKQTLGGGSALERSDRSADRDVLGQHFRDLNVDALARQVPRLDLVVFIVAHGRKNGAPTLGAEAVVTQAANEGTIGPSAAADTWPESEHVRRT